MSNVPASNTPQLGRNGLLPQFRIVTSKSDQKYESILDRIESLASQTLGITTNKDVSMICQIVRLLDPDRTNPISLPIASCAAILAREGRGYVCDPSLTTKCVGDLHSQLDSLLSSMEPGRIRYESIEPTTNETQVQLSPRAHSDAVIYIPQSDYHLRIFITDWKPVSDAPMSAFIYSKDAVDLWTVTLHQSHVFLSVPHNTLRMQYARKAGGQTHGFTLIVRDFLRNALALVSALQEASGTTPSSNKLYYPGVFDISADVRQHYNEKMERFKSQEESEAGNVRKYNNLIKTVLINQFVPTNCVVLDLACGHGQDLFKYGKRYPKLYLGVDISEGALAEARKRHSDTRKFKYTADFIQGNLMLPETFTEIERVAMAHGQSTVPCFDTVAMQLALHYLIPTEDDARKFFSFVASSLKPGGKFIATFPCCDRIARRMRNLESETGQYFFGNRQYRVTIAPEELAKMIPDCADKLTSPEAMEHAIEHEVDFDSVVDRLGSTWGLQYKFWLIETIDNQEEYVVPILALERLVNELGMKVEMSANFAEILQHYEDSQTIRDFRRAFPKLPLSDDEEEVFKFYRAIVIRKDE